MRFLLGLFLFPFVIFAAEARPVAAERKPVARQAKTTAAPPELLVRPITTPPPATAAAPIPRSSSLGETVRAPRGTSPTSLELSVGPGIVVYDGKYASAADGGAWGLSLNAGIVTPFVEHSSWFIGADLGIDSWDFTSRDKGVTFSGLGVQMLPTAYYRFDSIGGEVYPYVGASVGPNLYMVHANFNGISTSTYDFYLEILLRPGVTFQTSKEISFNFEPKFGVLGSSFIFMPMASANLSL